MTQNRKDFFFTEVTVFIKTNKQSTSNEKKREKKMV